MILTKDKQQKVKETTVELNEGLKRKNSKNIPKKQKKLDEAKAELNKVLA